MTVNSSTTGNWQKKMQAPNGSSKRRTKSRAVRDVLEPDVLRGTSPVLRGLRDGNVLRLPD
jgi:hypothetical protein